MHFDDGREQHRAGQTGEYTCPINRKRPLTLPIPSNSTASCGRSCRPSSRSSPRDTAAPPPLEEIYNRIGRPGQQEPLSAICLSGGGIRSATFNLGVLQHLAHLGILQRFDYLSSVSGGGYIASWLQAWMHHDKRALDQLQEFSRPNAFEPEPQPIRNLREYSNYLTPKLGLFSADTWTAAAMVVRNMLLNWLVLLPALAAVVAIPWLFLAAVENNDLFTTDRRHVCRAGDAHRAHRQHPGVPVAPLFERPAL